ncbi:cyclin-J isoform X2 [Diaphorina citri]|nr:cyclin-J isoform X2 [Diaphorina citri]
MPSRYVNYLNSRVHLDQYFVSVHEYYRKQEKNCPVYHFQSPELEYRSELVRWLKALQKELNFSTLALHLAVHLMDFFMDNHMIPIEKLSRVALVCVLTAVNFEDLDGALPRLQALCEKIGHEYNRKDIIEVQTKVLEFYKFHIGRPTVAHFTHIYSAFIVDFMDLDGTIGGNQDSLCIEYYDNAQTHICKLLDRCLNEVQYLKFEQSLVAAVFILAVRKSLELFPCWTKMLQCITGYSLEDLHPCIALYNTLQSPEGQISASDFELSTSDDSGYTTSGSCNSPQPNHSNTI